MRSIAGKTGERSSPLRCYSENVSFTLWVGQRNPNTQTDQKLNTSDIRLPRISCVLFHQAVRNPGSSRLGDDSDTPEIHRTRNVWLDSRAELGVQVHKSCKRTRGFPGQHERWAPFSVLLPKQNAWTRARPLNTTQSYNFARPKNASQPG